MRSDSYGDAMANTIRYQMTGLAELQRKLRDLAPKVAAKAVGDSLRVGSKLILKAMQNAAPHSSDQSTGFLPKHLGIRIGIYSASQLGVAYIGPEGRIDYPKHGTYVERLIRGKIRKTGRVAVATVARFLEFGTTKMSARPFMTRSFISVTPAVMAAVVAELQAGLKKLGP